MTRGTIHDGSKVKGNLLLDADVVVVGSGAGGAVLATELAEAGLEVVILEEGRQIPGKEHGAMSPSGSMRHAWREAGITAIFGRGDSPSMTLMMGRAVGGSSLLTGGVCFRTPERVLDEWVNQRRLGDLSASALEPCFDAVEKAVNVSTVAKSLRSRSAILFGEGLAKRGHALKPLRRNVKNCRGCAQCNFSCPHGAKFSVDISYLPRALDKGTQIYSHCLVEKVERDGDLATGVSGRLLNGPGGRAQGRLRVRAKRVVLACGAIHTPMVLAKSGIGRASDQLGRNMTVHPGFRVFARFDERVEGWKGAMQSAYCDDLEESHGINMVDIFVPPGAVAATLPGAGAAHRKRVAVYPYLAAFGGMIHDEAGGRVRRGIGREPLVTYRMSRRDRSRVPRLITELAETFLAVGAREIYLPILGAPPLDPDGFRKFDLSKVPGHRFESACMHPLGTCRMGDSPENSVVNSNGEVWGMRNLLVADSSVVPSSLGVNPQVTIMTLATHIAWRMRERQV